MYSKIHTNWSTTFIYVILLFWFVVYSFDASANRVINMLMPDFKVQ